MHLQNREQEKGLYKLEDKVNKELPPAYKLGASSFSEAFTINEHKVHGERSTLNTQIMPMGIRISMSKASTAQRIPQKRFWIFLG